jgi:hypothetical protein
LLPEEDAQGGEKMTAEEKLAELEAKHIELLHEIGRLKATLHALDEQVRRDEKYGNKE